jgi:cytoskeleton protein RodZ
MILLLDRVKFRAIQRKRDTDLPSFGEKLRQEREKRKITLEQISVSTKIGIRMLQALEEDKFNQLPGGIFNKGFVRAYSRCVGLDEDQAVADYLQASGDAPPVSTEIAPREDSERENEENIRRLEASSDAPARQLPWGLFAALLLLVALALSLWSHRRREHSKQSVPAAPATSPAPVPTTQLSDHLPSQVSGPVSNEDHSPGSTRSGPRTNGSPAAASTPSAQTSPVRAHSQPTAAPSSAAPKTLSGTATASANAIPGEFTVVIHAREESWISTTADGGTISSELLAADTERAVRGRKEVIVKTGNAGGVDFRFNGKKLDLGGASGEVRTVTFGPGGMVPNSPAPPSTP